MALLQSTGESCRQDLKVAKQDLEFKMWQESMVSTASPTTLARSTDQSALMTTPLDKVQASPPPRLREDHSKADLSPAGASAVTVVSTASSDDDDGVHNVWGRNKVASAKKPSQPAAVILEPVAGHCRSGAAPSQSAAPRPACAPPQSAKSQASARTRVESDATLAPSSQASRGQPGSPTQKVGARGTGAAQPKASKAAPPPDRPRRCEGMDGICRRQRAPEACKMEDNAASSGGEPASPPQRNRRRAAAGAPPPSWSSARASAKQRSRREGTLSASSSTSNLSQGR